MPTVPVPVVVASLADDFCGDEQVRGYTATATADVSTCVCVGDSTAWVSMLGGDIDVTLASPTAIAAFSTALRDAAAGMVGGEQAWVPMQGIKLRRPRVNTVVVATYGRSTVPGHWWERQVCTMAPVVALAIADDLDAVAAVSVASRARAWRGRPTGTRMVEVTAIAWTPATDAGDFSTALRPRR